MENPFMIKTVLKDNFWNLFSDFTYVAYIILTLIVFIVFVLLLTILYKKLRRKFPIKVNCWFCNSNTTVPYEFSNCWDCPHCKQYNGFDKDGGYNKIIQEQFNQKLNENVFTTFKTLESNDIERKTNGLCKLCNINQQLKIQQLALFVPLDEGNYNKEIEQYREKLEKAYKLCSKCEKTLQETLQKQEYNILTNRLNSHKHITLSQKLTHVDKFGRRNILAFIKKNTELGLKVLCIIIISLLFLALLNHFETENQLLSFALPDFIIVEPLQLTIQVLLNFIGKIYSFKREFSFAGLVLWFLADFKKQLTTNYACLLVWGFLHILSWTALTGPQVLLSGICLLLNVQGTQKRLIYVSKKSLPKNSGFQPIKKVFPEVYNGLNENCLETNGSFSSLINNKNFVSLDKENALIENKIKVKEQKFTDVSDAQEKKKMRKRENEIESLLNEEKEKMDLKCTDSLTNSSFNGKSGPSFVEADKSTGETQGPFSEVYNTLSSLHIGDKQKKSNRPPNFLFSNCNFSETKSPSSIIKPAKLIKNLNSSLWTEPNECNSRSSTPSSGYSSQKPEKPEPSRYDFSKPITPLSVHSFSRLSPNNYYDHYDNNHLFYNNMNCFSPSFVPFQQYPGPMGHTTIYTCTRPTTFPFPYSPCQGFPNQKFSPGSPRLSDASDCCNLFQDSSKSFERNKRLCKFKSFLYYFSIFLNITTIMSLLFFTSTGIVLVDWKLPKLNFFV